MDQLLNLIDRAGYYIRELNEKFYFYVDIETIIPWAVVFLLYLLYRLVSGYFRDRKLDSLELVKLLAIYLLILLVVMASYVDINVILHRANPEYSFFIITAAAIGIVLIMAWASRDPVAKKWWILGALFTPIILLMLTNGRILEERFDWFKSLMPRSDLGFLDLPGEVKVLRVGGLVGPDQVENLEQIITSHRSVYEAAVVGHRDEDNLVKPYAFVVLQPRVTGTNDLENSILAYVADKIARNWISPQMAPYWIDFVSVDKLPAEQYPRISKIMNDHPSVAASSVVGRRDEAIAYVVLKEGYPPSKARKQEILRFVYQRIRENNTMSPYLQPRWVKFIEKEDIPRNRAGKIKRHTLQKRVKNWSDVFPDFDRARPPVPDQDRETR